MPETPHGASLFPASKHDWSEFCSEVTTKTLKRSEPIFEVALYNYRPRRKAEGKKIRWTDGLEAIWTLIKYRFRD